MRVNDDFLDCGMGVGMMLVGLVFDRLVLIRWVEILFWSVIY